MPAFTQVGLQVGWPSVLVCEFGSLERRSRLVGSGQITGEVSKTAHDTSVDQCDARGAFQETVRLKIGSLSKVLRFKKNGQDLRVLENGIFGVDEVVSTQRFLRIQSGRSSLTGQSPKAMSCMLSNLVVQTLVRTAPFLV